MLYLLKLEWIKLNKLLSFRIFTLFYFVLLPAILLTGKRLDELPPPLVTNEVFFIFPTVWEYLGYVGNWLCFFFFGFLSIIIVTTEYSYRTMRQNIITGLSRRQYFMGKVYFILAMSLLATAYYVLCALLIGYFSTASVYWHKVWQNANYIPRYFLMCFGYMSFGLMLGFLVKRTGIALFLYLAYIMFLEMILRWGVHLQLFENRSMHFYPMNAVEDLVPLPFTQMADQFLSRYGFRLFLSPAEAAVTVITYSLIFILLAYYMVRRADL
ncbi:MAG: ABC transporter permease subunit [Lewinellaceae bacterium]|nr:ABC transporter permease subunit [Lewinellaceae bacterium]